MNNFITTNKKEVKFCFSLPIGPNTIFSKKTKIFMVKFLFLFFCFFTIGLKI